METKPTLHEKKYRFLNRKPKEFTSKMQEVFVLKIVGLPHSMIMAELNIPSESAVQGYIRRIVDFFPLHPQAKTLDGAIAMAMRTGFAKCLFDKFRDKHSKWILDFETRNCAFPVADLPGWTPQERVNHPRSAAEFRMI